MTGDCHVRFCEKPMGRFHRLTHHNLHWSLDVSFSEDHSRVRAGNATENLAIIRRIALNLLKLEKTNPRGITCKRKRSGWDHSYLLTVLLGAKKTDEIKN